NTFNFRNPAANGNFDLTAFSISATNENNIYKSNYQDINTKKHSSYLSNISLAFPITKKLKFGIGYQPYSSKTYDIISTSTLSDGTTKANRFKGEGTISTVQAGVSYKISKEFSLGLRSNFYFGKIFDIEEVSYSNAELISGYESSNKIKKYTLTTGATYQKTLENDRKLTFGATYTFGNMGTSTANYINSTYYYSGIDTKANQSIIEERTSNLKNIIPQEFSFGLGYGNEGKWFYSTQLDYKKGEGIEYLGQPFQYENSYKISAGGWYLPNYNNFRNYFSRVIYRFGAYYEKGNLSVSPLGSTTKTNVNQFAVTGGVTLPFANVSVNRINSVDIGFEVGKRGTLQNNMISQTFFNLKLGLNFADKWFQKRQYD
ncbi:MAG: hypothetical protein Q4C75_07365, partial [Bergeyella zoohelcum]|nr:hypothetical protein [Bergeyella zoohelcum]